MLVLASALVLAACGEESGDADEDRQFANDPVATREVTPTIAASPEPEMASPVAPEPTIMASPEVLLHSRGAPDTLYTLVNGELLAVTPSQDPVMIPLPAGTDILDFAGSPSGDRVAVLLRDEGGATVLSFLASDGSQVGDTTTLSTAPAAATPVAREVTSTSTVSWSPQGTEVLVLLNESLLRVTAQGEADAVDLGDIDGTVVSAALSPDGNRLLLHAVVGDDSHVVYVRDLADQRTREITALSKGPGTGLTALQWLPDSSGFVFVRGDMTQGVAMRGQLYIYVLGQEVPRLLATSGQGGPSATMTDAVLSPDGRKVAYVISILDGSRWVFHSMWVRSVDGNLTYSVPVSTSGVVVGPRWLSGGLVWEQRPDQDAAGSYVLARSDEEPGVVLEAAPEVQATPGASPVTGEPSPEASPMATPQH